MCFKTYKVECSRQNDMRYITGRSVAVSNKWRYLGSKSVPCNTILVYHITFNMTLNTDCKKSTHMACKLYTILQCKTVMAQQLQVTVGAVNEGWITSESGGNNKI